MSADGFAQPLTPEQLAALPHDSAAPRLNVVIWTLNGAAGVFLGLRLFCKLRHAGLWWDDWFLVGAWVCSNFLVLLPCLQAPQADQDRHRQIAVIVESSILSYLTTLGYGVHSWDFPLANLANILLPINVAAVFTCSAAIWSKTSFALTLTRLVDGKLKMGIWFVIITMNIGMGLSALFPWVQCTPLPKSWNPFMEGTCWEPHILIRYNIFAAGGSPRYGASETAGD